MSQTLSASTLLAVPLAPLAGALLAGIFGTTFGGNWIGRRLSHTLTILGVLVAFVLSAMTLKSVAIDGARFNETLYTWMVVGSLKMEVGFLVDSLTAMMMVVVTFVSLMVHIYTIGYMEEDDGYNRFFAYISLFTFSMLMLVMSNNLLQLFFGWEAVGLVSYLLIGFWFNKPSAIFANMKAFLVNRVGDFGFILGIGLIAAYAGTLNYGEVFAKTGELGGLPFPGTDWMLITVICICLFIGAMGKSAQFPLHVWLPDSMEGGGLFHAVAAGLYDRSAGRIGLLGGRIPPDDPRVLQGAAVPRGRLGHHGHAPQPGYPLDGRRAQVHAHHLDHLTAGFAGVDRYTAVLGLLLQGQHH